MDDVLEFWFADKARWWKKDPAFDADVTRRFGALHAAIERGEHDDWLQTPRGALAYVIVLDQFSRNMFRGDARSFASDARARTVAKAALEKGFDRELSQEERGFLYMPLMHSEELEDQDRCVALFAAQGEQGLDYAKRHRDIVARFGRFLGRHATLVA